MNTPRQLLSWIEYGENTHESGLISKISLYSTLLFVFLIPWGNGVYDGFVRIFGILAFGVAILYLITYGIKKNFTFFHFFVVILWSWVILSVAWTSNLEEGKTMAPRIFQIMFLPFLLTLIINNNKRVFLAYQSYVLGTIVASLIIIYNLINGIESAYYGRYTVQNTETDSMSIILVLAVPIAAYLGANTKKNVLKAMYTLSIPLIIFAIFLTGTRTGSIVSMVGVLYLFYTYRKSSLKIKGVFFIVGIASLIAVLTLAPKASVDRVFSAGKSLQSGDLNNRTIVWTASLDQWKKSPVIGTGLGGLGDVLSRKHVNYKAAHNTHIHLLTENGLIGFFIYLLIELTIVLAILHSPPEDRVYLFTLLMSVIISQLTLHTHIFKETWFVLTMIIIHSGLASKKVLVSADMNDREKGP